MYGTIDFSASGCRSWVRNSLFENHYTNDIHRLGLKLCMEIV